MHLVDITAKSLPVTKAGSKGVVFYRGQSMLDGAEIVAIATLKTNNVKTGDMVQTWILRSDMNPLEAISIGEDSSICGNCRHRGQDGKNRSCYVNVHQAPLNIYRTFKAGKYTEFDTVSGIPAWVHGRRLRCGSYGDPAAVPFEIFEKLTKASDGWTGYTHQWKNCDQRYRSVLMASVDSVEERDEAKSKGWRTFRVRSVGDSTSREVICPASEEAGKKKTCEECLACAGTRHGKLSDKAADVVIIAHGSPVRLRAWGKNRPTYEAKAQDLPSGQPVGDRRGHPVPSDPAGQARIHTQEDAIPCGSTQTGTINQV